MEEKARRTGFPILGPAAGYYCYQVARLVRAHSVFELGSGFGYSTAWFARAVMENGGGAVHHTVWDAELTKQARRHLSHLGLEGVVQYHTGEALAALSEFAGEFDLIFMDIDKHQHPAALPLIDERLRPEGVVMADNALWGGRIFGSRDQSAATRGCGSSRSRSLIIRGGWLLWCPFATALSSPTAFD